jgi:ribosome recycling factor
MKDIGIIKMIVGKMTKEQMIEHKKVLENQIEQLEKELRILTRELRHKIKDEKNGKL